ncbi:hypothetical protein AV530_002188 [Patagioenas fasciata monilis]|uniref:Uncharacterized protein n=1 Tax=Patagioenas fasciata monilis TaxID=372326 RepID=A0A1V4K5H0_PATFA|nr:hypothetical protein AV530_002188 [Patagioenas fasciata monilis]
MQRSTRHRNTKPERLNRNHYIKPSRSARASRPPDEERSRRQLGSPHPLRSPPPPLLPFVCVSACAAPGPAGRRGAAEIPFDDDDSKGRKGFITTKRAKKHKDLKKQHFSNSFQKLRNPAKPEEHLQQSSPSDM